MTQAFHFKFCCAQVSKCGRLDYVNQEVHDCSNLLCVLNYVSDDNGEWIY